MKYFFNVFLTAFILSGSCYILAQDKSLSAGKAPFIESMMMPDYSGDGNNLAIIAYGISSIRYATLSIPIPSGTPLDSLNSWTPPNFAASMTKGGDGKYYIIEWTPSLYELNPGNGSVALLGAITGLGADFPNGIAYNPADGRYFIATSTDLYSFNVTTRVATLIGPFNVAGGLMIDLAFTCGGVCYAYDLSTDMAYTINISTGNATALGALGYDAGFGQGMSIDHETGVIYLSAFNSTTFTGQLRTMNPANGNTTLVVDWGFEQIAPFAIEVNCAPDPPTLQSPSNGATGISVNPTLTWNASSGANSYGLQIALNAAFVFPSIDFNGLTGTSFAIPIDLPANTIFYWRVNASNSNGTSAYSSTRNFTTVTQINLSQSISFPNKTNPSDYTSNEYKIVGLPGEPNLNVGTLLSGSQGTDWEAYRDNGDATNYYEKYNSASPFSFTKGKAYWIIRKGNLVINQTVLGARVNGSGYTDIPLSTGFNLITNPYIVQVLWSGILAANALPAGTPLNSFSTSGWGTSANMQAYSGYLFDNANDLSTLRIPYPIVSSPLQKPGNLDLWRINVHLECNEFIDENTSFGVSLEANQDRDKYDFRKPRSPGSIPMVYFYHPDWDDGYGLFATDMRPEFEEIQEWDLKVDSKLQETIKLSFDGLENVPDDMEIYLMDIDRSYSINLRESTEYTFVPVKNISQLKVVVGKSEKVNSVLNSMLPTEFVLGNNFPNPFNPATTIQVSVPNTTDIMLLVYNILGQEIRVLFEGTAEPGRHWYAWDGKDQQGITVPSGIYIYTLRTNSGINISRKMVLMK